MMALLVGAQIAAQFLGLTRGSSSLLSEIFPAITDIKRLDLKPDAAQAILVDAERHLGIMAVPYTLAIHEGFISDCLELVGVTSSVKAWSMHSRLEKETNGSFTPGAICQFHVLREMRNAVIHRGGEVDQRLIDAINNLTPDAEQDWKKHAGRTPHGLANGDQVTLGSGELVLALAVTKALAREANRMLIRAVPASKWAEIIVDDYLEHGARKVLHQRKRRNAIFGHQRFRYSALSIPESDLAAAAAARGYTIE